MDECEALCTRMTIMVNGRFQCLGSPQHLKSKFDEGYTLIIKLRIDPVASGKTADSSLETKTRAVMDYVSKTFPGSQLKDQHDGRVHYHIGKQSGMRWAQLFGAVERVRSTYDIEDYTVSQTTLEDIFIRFARMQRGVQSLKRRFWFF